MLLVPAALVEKDLLSPGFIWEHAVFLLCALEEGEHLSQGRGTLRKMLTAA